MLYNSGPWNLVRIVEVSVIGGVCFRRFHCRWFSCGVASLPEGKSRGLCLVQLCAKYRLVNATLRVLNYH